MLAANSLTQQRLSQARGSNVHEYAADQSDQSIRRFLETTNRKYEKAGLRVVYDGQIIRCVTTTGTNISERVWRHEAKIAEIDPLCSGAPNPGLLSAIDEGVVWLYDLKELAGRYTSIKDKVAAIAATGEERLTDVPVVIGGDWEFNAWACPAEVQGDFIMVNFGFIQAYTYAAMFLEMLEECKQAAEKGGASGVITSSMIWMAATVLGYESRQWVNLRLPTSEQDRIWCAMQNPSDRLKHAIAAVDAFAMLHECGHIACGHTDCLREWLRDDNPSEAEHLRRLELIREMEFEADRFACQSICSKAGPGRELFDALLILFSMLRLCEDRGNPPTLLSSTHPCATDRFGRCDQLLAQDADDRGRLLEEMATMIVDTTRRRLEWQEQQKRA